MSVIATCLLCHVQQMILETPVEDWPVVDCLLSWHSDGFPLHKAQVWQHG